MELKLQIDLTLEDTGEVELLWTAGESKIINRRLFNILSGAINDELRDNFDHRLLTRLTIKDVTRYTGKRKAGDLIR
jgi:hypothetical protein